MYTIVPESKLKVTYYLGAGASAKALPTVKKTETTDGLSDSFNQLCVDLQNNTNISSNNEENRTKIIQDLNWIIINSYKFGTIDTFAKFLYLKKKYPELENLKNTLAFYFTYKQFFKQVADERALIFLTSVMQNGEIFPPNIKIINWNYDLQIQIAGSTFREEEFSHYKRTTTHKPGLINYYPSLGHQYIYSQEEYSMVHLNGIAGLYYDQNTALNIKIQKSIEDINDIFHIYREVIEKNDKLITFAWEKNIESGTYLQERNKLAKFLVSETNILVIIGYSFPYFNRDVDKEIFDEMKKSGKLKKIFFQDPYRNGDFLYNQFELDKSIEINNIKETDNYFIPLEL